jgi:hypothetical protein
MEPTEVRSAPTIELLESRSLRLRGVKQSIEPNFFVVLSVAVAAARSLFFSASFCVNPQRVHNMLSQFFCFAASFEVSELKFPCWSFSSMHRVFSLKSILKLKNKNKH